jgi:peroxiredoxin
LYRTFGLNLEKYNDARTVELPLPATFLIDTQQVIQYAFADEDYACRAEPDEILEVLSVRKEEECVYC